LRNLPKQSKSTTSTTTSSARGLTASSVDYDTDQKKVINQLQDLIDEHNYDEDDDDDEEEDDEDED
jgi:hypothetical protein